MAIVNFRQRSVNDNIEDALNIGTLMKEGDLTNSEIVHLKQIREAWDFYEGYHWEGIDDLDHPQTTYNYCRPFVNKFVAFEFGKGFNIKTPVEIEERSITVNDPIIDNDPDLNADGEVSAEEATQVGEETVIRQKTQGEYLNEVWKNNNKDILATELGQTKSITGEAWVKVQFQSPEDLFDPFGEFPDGKIKLSVVPTQFVFPTYNDHDKDVLESLLIMYPITAERETGLLARRKVKTTVLYREYWTANEIIVYTGGVETDRMENPYGVIPFVQIKNFPIAGKERGQGDLEDIIPLNVEFNTKKSDVSEVIDYHSAPITLVYGAKIGNLEKGANKVWGGLPKDAKVENLGLQGDLTASSNYIADCKTAMCEIGGIPETVLGGAAAISNTSGVALQYINLPLIERTRVKRICTSAGLVQVNKLILFISLAHGLIEKPEEISMRDFLSNEVEMPDTLPKDQLIELQQIQQELTLGLECRHGAMERLGKDNIRKKINEIDRERAEHPELFNPMLQTTWYQNMTTPSTQTPTNAGGMMNGQTPQEQKRVAMTGQNGGADTQ